MKRNRNLDKYGEMNWSTREKLKKTGKGMKGNERKGHGWSESIMKLNQWKLEEWNELK